MRESLQQEVFKITKEFVGQNLTLTIPTTFIEFTGDVCTALLLSQLLYWTDKPRTKDGWISRTYQEWEQEIKIKERIILRCTSNLIQMGILDKRIQKIPMNTTTQYKINIEVFSKIYMDFIEKRCLKRESKNHQIGGSGTTKTVDVNSNKTISDRIILSKDNIKYVSAKHTSRIPPADKVIHTYAKKVERLFDEYNELKIVSHSKSAAVYDDARRQLALKLKSYSVEQVQEVFQTYKQCYDSPVLRNKINNGNKIGLPALLNNKYGKFDWFEYFLSKSYDQIWKERTKGRPSVDSHPDLTKLLANEYAKKFQGRATYPIEDSNNYKQFQLAGDKFLKFQKDHEKCNDFALRDTQRIAEILMCAVSWEIREHEFEPSPGRICSEHCWTELLPKYYRNQYPTMEGI